MKQILSVATIHFMLLSLSFSQPRNIYDIYALEYIKGSSRTPASVIAPGADALVLSRFKKVADGVVQIQ